MRYSWVLQPQPQQLSRMRVLRKGCSVLGYLVWVSSFSPWVVVSCRLVQKKQTGHFWQSWLMSMSSRCSWITGSISWTSMIDWPTTIMFQTDIYIYVWKESKKDPTKATDGTYPKTCPIWARFQSRQKDFPSRRRFPPRRRRVVF